ncbi:MAG: glycosyltransferase [Candidatus Kuenenia sp.]|nr:glycosyltransferase [Candidatus Kuenenia hertensis]
MSFYFIDIIIPVKEINNYIYESVPEMLNLDYENFGIIIFPDTFNGDERLMNLAQHLKLKTQNPKLKIIPTGNIGPAQKRDLALKHSDADIFAFLDDDAYPRKDWLKNAVKHFHDPLVAAVGGPAITPPNNSFYQKVSGAVFLSKISGGNPERYWPIGKIREVDDWPSVNLLVRRGVFEKIGGFNSAYWPGEDTKLCLDIVKLGGKIIYDPDVIAWHHRREGLKRHLRQIGRYGLHRGFFAKKFPETSLRLKYFIPSFFVIFLLSYLPLSLYTTKRGCLAEIFNGLYCSGITIYFVALGIAFYQIYRKEKNFSVSLVSLFYIFLTHIWYGIRFLQGFLFTKDLKSKLRS